MLQAIPQLAANPALLEKLRQERPARKAMVEGFWREKLPIGEATIELLLMGDTRKVRPCCLNKKCYRNIPHVSGQNLDSSACQCRLRFRIIPVEKSPPLGSTSLQLQPDVSK